MGNSAKYTPLDHGGLEVVPPSEAPQVMGDDDERLPEVGVNRKSSLLKPEALAREDDKEAYRPVDGEHAPEVDYRQGQAYAGSGKRIEAERYEEEGKRKEKTYCCGLSRRAMIILIVVVTLVVVLGAVLGGTLGTLLGKKSTTSQQTTSSAPLETMQNTGLASAVSSSDASMLLTYYQDPQGRIIENVYQGGSWTLSDRSNINKSVVTTSAIAGSPLAAISYPYNGDHVRQIFFVTATGAIMTANSTKTLQGTQISTSWSAARAITTELVAPNSIGLAACWSTQLMNGIRAFYPSQFGYVQEMKWTFGEDGWKQGDFWLHADLTSGFGCVVSNTPADQYINLYLRWNTGEVRQVWFDYLHPNGSTIYSVQGGPQSPPNQTIASGSDIAVSSSSQTEYVYWTLEDGSTSRGVVNPSSSYYDSFENFTLKAGASSKLAAAFIDGGSLLMFQNTTSDSTIQTDNVARNGVELSSGAVP